jgi:glutamate-1-semialdehyde 2,1-aminomutase
VAAEQLANKEKFKALGIYNEVTIDPYWETPEFEDFVSESLTDVRFLHITGGEPFIIPEVLNILDQVLYLRDTINLSFNTNLTRVSDRLMERLKQFKNLNLYVSLEGVGDMNDYIRYPSKWAEILDNIERFRTQAPNAVINVQHVFQHTSVYAFPELAEFQTENNFRLFPTLIQGRDFLTFESVPPADLERFRQWVANTNLITEEHRNFMSNTIKNVEFDPELHRKFVNYTNLLDSIRGTDYNKIFNPSPTDR